MYVCIIYMYYIFVIYIYLNIYIYIYLKQNFLFGIYALKPYYIFISHIFSIFKFFKEKLKQALYISNIFVCIFIYNLFN